MRLMFATILVLAALPAAHAQSAQNASTALKQTSIAAGAVTESGLRATSGVVAIPLGATAVASGAVGVGAGASGQTDIAKGFSGASLDASKGAKAMVDFSNAPLAISDDVVIAKPKAAPPQSAPKVPYSPVEH